MEAAQVARQNQSGKSRALLRLLSFVPLHLGTYALNVLVLWVCFKTQHYNYMGLLLPVHLVIGGLCAYTSVMHSFDLEELRNDGSNPFLLLKLILVVVIFGFMQFIQVKLAVEDFFRIRREGRSEGEELQVPGMTPARYYCKATDGILESSAFAFVSVYMLVKYKMFEEDFPTAKFKNWHFYLFYACAVVNFLTTGLALMEVDHRTSMAVQRVLKSKRGASFRHLAFRSCEVALRLMSVGLFCSYLRLFQNTWWIAFIIVGLDYVLGILLLVCIGGEDSAFQASVLLGIPLFIANVMQFVDIPGMSLPSRRISCVIIPFRTLELLLIFLFILHDPQQISTLMPNGTIVKKHLFDYLYHDQTEFLVAWLLVGAIYYTMLVTYVQYIKPDADLHSAVAFGEFDSLQALLCESELVLNVNRYGPEGRTPLHLAALRGQVDCVKLLLKNNADINQRTGDSIRNTALHLAVRSSVPQAVTELCRHSSDADFLNAQNTQGDTALHVAARRHNKSALQELLSYPQVNTKLINGKGMTPAECVPSEKFGFDWTSTENAINDLFRDVEQGNLRRQSSQASSSTATPTVEMQPVTPKTPKSLDDPRSDLGTPLQPEGETSEPSTPDASPHQSAVDRDFAHVVLTTITPSQEEEFVKRCSTGRDSQGGSSVTTFMEGKRVSQRGISSFMMSAGMGTISRAFLNSISEEEEATVDPTINVKFDDFVEEKELGRGSFGRVLLVRYKPTGEHYAMKLMEKQLFRAQKITAKADSEQFILKTMRHKFIVNLFFAFQGSTFWVLVMDYCPNGDLQDVLVVHGKPGLALKDGARLAGEVLLALEHLHRMRVIFRDLKLENVVMNTAYRAQLTDFGLAKKLYTTLDAKTMCGSYGYAAPEIMLNTGKYSFAVDLYSYGVLLYMLLSGGETPKSKPHQRLPPMRHKKLRQELRENEAEPKGDWATPAVCAMPLLMDLTSENIVDRGSCTAMKERDFFKNQLENGVDYLMDDPGPFPNLTGKPQKLTDAKP